MPIIESLRDTEASHEKTLPLVLAIVVGIVAYFGVSSYLERALPSERKMTRAEVLASATELDFDQYYGEYKSNKVLAGEKRNGNCYVTTATVNNIGVNGISNLLGLTELFKPGNQKEIQVVVEHVVGNTHVISIAS